MSFKIMFLLLVIGSTQVNSQYFPITDRFIDFVLAKLEASSLFDIQSLINLSFDRTSTLVDDLIIKIKNILCEEIKEELKIFKLAALIISISILIGSICFGAACLILVIKRYKVRNMYLVDLSNIKKQQQSNEMYKIQDNNQKKYSYNFN